MPSEWPLCDVTLRSNHSCGCGYSCRGIAWTGEMRFWLRFSRPGPPARGGGAGPRPVVPTPAWTYPLRCGTSRGRWSDDPTVGRAHFRPGGAIAMHIGASTRARSEPRTLRSAGGRADAFAVLPVAEKNAWTAPTPSRETSVPGPRTRADTSPRVVWGSAVMPCPSERDPTEDMRPKRIAPRPVPHHRRLSDDAWSGPAARRTGWEWD